MHDLTPFPLHLKANYVYIFIAFTCLFLPLPAPGGERASFG
uniref:Uncharacterized protein n=1 Tax=Rhizophora mucronata TaxID=61149 RepID=A0A2P2PLG0_RHIMU